MLLTFGLLPALPLPLPFAAGLGSSPAFHSRRGTRLFLLLTSLPFPFPFPFAAGLGSSSPSPPSPFHSRRGTPLLLLTTLPFAAWDSAPPAPHRPSIRGGTLSGSRSRSRGEDLVHVRAPPHPSISIRGGTHLLPPPFHFAAGLGSRGEDLVDVRAPLPEAEPAEDQRPAVHAAVLGRLQVQSIDQSMASVHCPIIIIIM